MPRQPHYTQGMADLLAEIRACARCTGLPLGPAPLVQAERGARILIAGQAPGVRAHRSGIPFDDPSGDRLREWMGIDRNTFYDASRIAIVPMAFCYPGTGPSGDFPPPPLCAQSWRAPVLAGLGPIDLTLVIGRHAMDWHMPGRAGSVTGMVVAWRDRWPAMIPLPHPSPRNNRWLKANPWFAHDVVPALQERVRGLIGG